jgi:hypothetical protein
MLFKAFLNDAGSRSNAARRDNMNKYPVNRGVHVLHPRHASALELHRQVLCEVANLMEMC